MGSVRSTQRRLRPIAHLIADRGPIAPDPPPRGLIAPDPSYPVRSPRGSLSRSSVNHRDTANPSPSTAAISSQPQRVQTLLEESSGSDEPAIEPMRAVKKDAEVVEEWEQSALDNASEPEVIELESTAVT